MDRDFFLLHSVLTSSGTHPASYPVGTRSNSQGHEIDPLPPSSAKVKNAWNHNPTTLNVFMAFLFIKHRESLTIPEFMLHSDGMHPELILQYCIFGVE
jgi:hypothetical protein